ncbi:pre-mRNA-splicing factor cwc22-like [Phyllostomus discolor]|uniref:Pre-mRNA-splicing factor cwc22-like n=1 Tax=Phyllostomus discolor TaxID=89673 RepID=A0A7E6E4E1_9CHIR|nr:pre-mRNA-splicing factor cwc22-like [Phyllostomus discolor]
MPLSRGPDPRALRLPPRAVGAARRRTQGQQHSIARTHQVRGTGPCRGPGGCGPQGRRAGGRARPKLRIRGCPALQPAGRDLGRSQSPWQGRGPGVPSLQRCGSSAPEPRARLEGEGEPPPQGRRLLCRCLTWARSGGEARDRDRQQEGRAATNTQVSPASGPPTRPACSYLSTRAALPPGNLRRRGLLCPSANRPERTSFSRGQTPARLPGPRLRHHPPARGRSPPGADLPEPPLPPGLFPNPECSRAAGGVSSFLGHIST